MTNDCREALIDEANKALARRLSSGWTGESFADYKAGFFDGYEAARAPVEQTDKETTKRLSEWLSGAIGEGEPWEWEQEAKQLLAILRPYLRSIEREPEEQPARTPVAALPQQAPAESGLVEKH